MDIDNDADSPESELEGEANARGLLASVGQRRLSGIVKMAQSLGFSAYRVL
jgi:hypothetical protein